MEQGRVEPESEGDTFYRPVSPGLVREETDGFSEPPADLSTVQLGHQAAFLRPGHYTVVTSDGAVVHHVGKSESGEATATPFEGGADALAAGVEKTTSTEEPQYLVSDLATYQLSAAGDVYKLVVRAEKDPPVPESGDLHPYSHLQISGEQLPDSGHQDAVVAWTPSPSPIPPPPQHCLICDLSLVNYKALGIYGHTTHQTNTTYALKLRQVTGHAGNLVYHSEVICESCASLLNVADSFEVRLREIQTRLEETRDEVTSKFMGTCSRYPALSVSRTVFAEVEAAPEVTVEKADVKPHARAPQQGRKRRSDSREAGSEQPQKKKPRGKTAPVKTPCPEDKAKTEEPTSQKLLPRRAAAGRVPLVDESEEEDAPPEQDAFLRPEAAPASVAEAHRTATTSQSRPRRTRLLNRCPTCHVVHDNVHVFRAHLVTHEELGADEAADHLTQKTHEQLVYGCSRCTKTFASYRDQQRHVRTRHPRFSRCAVCLTQVEQAPGLMRSHLATHPEQNRCSFCSLPADTVEELCKHTEQQHAQALISLYCELCRAFVDESAFAGHIRNSHAGVPELSVQCHVCGQYVRKTAYLAHVRVHEATFPCQFCSRTFPNATALVIHERSHTGERPFTCQHCRKGFISKATLDAHVSTFHAINKYECSQCDRSYPSEPMLRRHELRHSETKPFTCQVCQKGFSLENHLNLHVRAIHLGETPHECHICQKRFPYKSSLKDHMYIHTGDKSFCCHTCGKRFRTAKILRSHSFTHRKEKPYRCDVRGCGRSFSRKDLLARHQLGSHGIQPEVRYSRLQSKESAPAPAAAPAAPETVYPPATEVQYVLYQTTPRPGVSDPALYPA